MPIDFEDSELDLIVLALCELRDNTQFEDEMTPVEKVDRNVLINRLLNKFEGA